MTLRVAGLVEESIVDGPGLRLTVFAQGCGRGCPGCHNPTAQDYAGGTAMRVEEILDRLAGNPLLTGLSLSGGEPFDQADAFAVLARSAQRMGYHIMAWSGYTFEELATNPTQRRLLRAIDVLVDGPFILGRRTLALPWRGSSNQRLLDVPRSLMAGRGIERKGV